MEYASARPIPLFEHYQALDMLKLSHKLCAFVLPRDNSYLSDTGFAEN